MQHVTGRVRWHALLLIAMLCACAGLSACGTSTTVRHRNPTADSGDASRRDAAEAGDAARRDAAEAGDAAQRDATEAGDASERDATEASLPADAGEAGDAAGGCAGVICAPGATINPATCQCDCSGATTQCQNGAQRDARCRCDCSSVDAATACHGHPLNPVDCACDCSGVDCGGVPPLADCSCPTCPLGIGSCVNPQRDCPTVECGAYPAACDACKQCVYQSTPQQTSCQSPADCPPVPNGNSCLSPVCTSGCCGYSSTPRAAVCLEDKDCLAQGPGLISCCGFLLPGSCNQCTGVCTCPTPDLSGAKFFGQCNPAQGEFGNAQCDANHPCGACEQSQCLETSSISGSGGTLACSVCSCVRDPNLPPAECRQASADRDCIHAGCWSSSCGSCGACSAATLSGSCTAPPPCKTDSDCNPWPREDPSASQPFRCYRWTCNTQTGTCNPPTRIAACLTGDCNPSGVCKLYSVDPATEQCTEVPNSQCKCTDCNTCVNDPLCVWDGKSCHLAAGYPSTGTIITSCAP